MSPQVRKQFSNISDFTTAADRSKSIKRSDKTLLAVSLNKMNSTPEAEGPGFASSDETREERTNMLEKRGITVTKMDVDSQKQSKDDSVPTNDEKEPTPKIMKQLSLDNLLKEPALKKQETIAENSEENNSNSDECNKSSDIKHSLSIKHESTTNKEVNAEDKVEPDLSARKE